MLKQLIMQQQKKTILITLLKITSSISSLEKKIKIYLKNSHLIFITHINIYQRLSSQV